MPQSHTHSAEARPGWAFAAEAAEILGLSRDTLIRLTDAGQIPCWRVSPTAQRRWDRRVLEDIRAKAGAA